MIITRLITAKDSVWTYQTGKRVLIAYTSKNVQPCLERKQKIAIAVLSLSDLLISLWLERSTADCAGKGGIREMIKCASPFGYYNRCVVDMDTQQSLGGTICCDTAEDANFDRTQILKQCPYAVEVTEE